MFGMAGAICGISISYLLGFKFGPPLINRFGPRLHITEKRLKWAKVRFKKYGGLFLIGSYFLPGIRHIAAYLAGVTTYKFRRFAIFAYIGAIVWVTTFIFLGFVLGHKWSVVEYIFRNFSLALIIILIVGITSYLFYRNNRRIS